MTDLFNMGYEDKVESARNAEMKTVRLLSLFSGIGAFEKALDRQGIPYELIAYCEIDKYASKAYSAIHGVSEEKNLWDVCKVDAKPFKGSVDLLTYGFPCTDISVAGRQAGFFDEEGGYTRSGLFFEALRIINECKPRIAIAENVKNLMSQAFVDAYHTVQESLGEAGYTNYVAVLNAKDFGIPQNRERVFIVSIRKDIDEGYLFPNPIPLELCLRDMLEEKVAEKYYLSEKTIKSFEEHARRNAENGNGFGWNVVDMGNERERENKPDIDDRCGEVHIDLHKNFVRARERECVKGVLLSEKGTKMERETDVASTLMARDYKGFGNQAMTGVMEVATERERKPSEKNRQHGRQGNTVEDGLRQFRLESDPMRGNGSRQHDAVCRGNGMQGYGIADLGGINATLTANGGGLAKTGGNLIVEKFDG